MEFHLKEFEHALSVSRIANLHYFEFTREYQTVQDKHGFHELLYVDKGAITVHSEHYSGLLADGQMIIHMPDEVHSLNCGDGIAPNVIIIGFETSCRELERFACSPVTLSEAQKKELTEVLQEGMEVYAPPYNTPYLPEMKRRQNIPYGADQLLHYRLEIFLIQMIRNARTENAGKVESMENSQKWEHVHRYILEHYNQKITLDQLCLLFGVNRATLCADFRRAYGDSIVGYINRLRIEEAKRLLRTNTMSVTDVAAAVGVGSIHYFCRMFKKCTGQSPGEYLESIRAQLEL